MSAYIIVEAIITKPQEFVAYAQAVPPIVAQYGGVYRVLGGEAESLEGDWGATRLVMHEWPQHGRGQSILAEPRIRLG